jgi:uncharacterized protein involved in exopolysaccharide biosynthesis
MTDFPLMYREDRDERVPMIGASIPADFFRPGLSLAQIASIVWAYRRLSTLVVILVLCATAVILVWWPRTYTAKATLMVNYEINDPLNGKELPVGQVGSYIATQAEMMQTPDVLLAVVDRLHLTEDADYARGFRDGGGTRAEWAAAKIARKLVVSPSQLGSQLISVSFSANDAKQAADVANAIADVYKEQDRRRADGRPLERARQNAGRLDELKDKVDAAQARLTEFHQRTGLIDDGSNANLSVGALANVEGRLLEAQHLRRVAEARALEDPSVSDQTLSSNQVQLIRAQLATQELNLERLTRTFTPAYPGLREAQLEVDDLKRALASAIKNHADNAKSALAMARQVEQKLQREVAEKRAASSTQGRLHEQAAKYFLEFQSAQEVYKRALDGYDQVRFAAESGPSSNVDVVSRATPPMVASSPKILTVSLLGCMAAALLGLGIPLSYELLNRRVRCRDDLERHHGVPVLVEFGRLSRRSA